MDSAKIKKQIKPVWGFLSKEIIYWDNDFWKKNLARNFYPLEELLVSNNFILPTKSFALKPYISFNTTFVYYRNN